MASIIVVEDDRLLGTTIKASLADDGHSVHWAASGEEALSWFDKHQAELALVDIGLPGLDGIELLEKLAVSQPDTGVVVMTANSDVRTAVEAMKSGAIDFLLKPLDLEAVSLVASKSLRHRRLLRAWEHERQQNTQAFGSHQIIGESPEIEKAKTLVRRISRLEIVATTLPPNILITGETGTGKDLLARAFHYEGHRRDGPFVHVNCAALPESLVESELFGFAKGAFTGAQRSKRGLFDVADRGTLFLDEVASLTPPLQSKILVAIETGRIRPVGSVDEKTVNVQLITAMNQNPEELIEAGRFREDLYHRLRVIHVHLPPLRARGKDLHILADHFLARHCRRFGMDVKRLTDRAREALAAYSWPGNVRELCHRLESAVLLSDGDIDADLIPSSTPQAGSVQSVGDGNCILIDFSRGPIALADVERRLIHAAMAATGHNVSRSAELLAISRDTLRYRLDKYGLAGSKQGQLVG